MARLVRSHDWANTSLGPVEAWPQSLKTILGVMLGSRDPMLLFWGPELLTFYNDAYRPICAGTHPGALGRPAPQVWSDSWNDVEPHIGSAHAGVAVSSGARSVVVERNGIPEESYFDLSYSPVLIEAGTVGGVFCICTEVTGTVISERRFELLRDLAAVSAAARSAEAVCVLSAKVLESYPADVSFALIYLLDEKAARLAARAGVIPGEPAAANSIGAADNGSSWQVQAVAESQRARLVVDIAARFDRQPSDPRPAQPGSAFVLPIIDRGLKRGIGAVVLGISSRRPFDEKYRGWLTLVAEQLGSSISIVQARWQGEHAPTEDAARLPPPTEQAVDGLFVATATGRFVDVNDAGCDIFGMTRDQVMHSAFTDVLLPEEHHRIVAEVARMDDGNIARSEWRFRRTDGSVFVGEVVGRRLPDGQLQGILRDITERKRAEETLRQGEHRFRTFADTAPALLWTTEPDGSCSFLSRGWYEFTGQTPETGLGFGWLGAVHPDDTARSGEIFSAANEKHEGFALEYRLRGADGGYRWAIDAGRPRLGAKGEFLGFIGSVTDIHDRKRSEDALAAEKQILEHVAAGSPLRDVLGMLTRMCEAQSTEGMLCSVLVIDEAGERLLHGAAPSLPDEYNQAIDGIRIGATVGSCGTAAYLQRSIGVADIATDPLWANFKELASAHGLAACWSQPIVSSHGRVLGTLAMYYRRPHVPSAHDQHVTTSAAQLAGIVIERADAEKQLRRSLAAEQHARTESERLSRMKDEFLTTLSHELRTPLNAILGWSQIIKRGAAAGDSARQGLDTIERNARLQAQMIEDLLDVSRITSGKVRLDVQRVRLCGIIEAALDSIRPGADARGIRIQTLLDCKADQVNGDPARLQQVAWNLLSNAVKFATKGGRIQVLLERVNSHVELSVSDNGLGIAAEFLPYVFERFRQADQSTTRRFGGLGIGLSIVRNLVELHGGSVRAESGGEGQGATFTVALPLSLDRRPHGHSVDDAAEQSSLDDLWAGESDTLLLAGVAVLYVDDELDARQLVERILSEQGARVVTAESASQARRLLPDVRPDVLIADIGMPDEDGYSFIRSVRALPSDQGGTIPAAAVTAMARSEDRRRALMAGFQTHVAKPVEVMELVAVVASLTGRTGR